MKVALVNKNPAVSRLITLSLNKIGVEYVEFDDVNAVSGEFDYIIIDSDMESADVKFDQKVMYLAPRGGIKPDFADIMLEKPFLPTEFINLFEESKAVNVAGDDTKAELGLDDSANFDDFEHIDENYEELQNFELPEIDTDFENLAKEDETEKLDDLDDNVLNDELLKEHLEDSSVGDLEDEEISLDEADTELIDENSEETEAANENVDDESSKTPKAEETIEDGLSSDFGDLSALVDEIENMDESSPVDEEARDELEKIVEQNTQNLKTDENDEELDDISQSKKELSEIDSLDEELNSEEADETDAKNLEQEELNIDELAKFDDEDSLENEINLEDKPKDDENLDESSEADEEQIQVDDEKAEEDIEEEALDEISSEELENLEPSENTSNEMPVEELEDVSEPEAKEDLGLADETFEEENAQEEDTKDESKDAASSELNFDVASIDDIDENTMLAAFGLKDMPQTRSKNDAKEDYKEELTKKITKHVHESLNESSLRDVLKDMNIKINISFEEK